MGYLKEWGFEGHFVSDCWAIQDFHQYHHITDNPVDSAAMAINAGCDLNCGCTYEKLVAAVLAGKVKEETVRESAVRLFTTRYMLGIMGEGSEYDAIPYTVVECEAHQKKADQAALEGCVLLKNDGMLPLDENKIKTLGVIGPNADSIASLVGNYHGTSSHYITVQRGFQEALAGKARVLSALGCHLYKDKADNLSQFNDDRLSEALTVAENSDAVVLVVGLDETLEGEQGDTGNPFGSDDKARLLLPDPQQRLMDAVLAVGKPTVIVLMAGSAIDLSEAEPRANAILLSWYPGAGGGRAVAELLFGKASPSGKLPVTFYRSEALPEMPDFTDYTMNNRTYRYYHGTPLYPFGYGLSYGDCLVTQVTADGKQAFVTARNEGARETEEVIELYLRDEESPLAPPNPILCGFRRIRLAAGEEKRFCVGIDPSAFTVVTEAGERIPGSGSWTLYAGFGGPDPRSGELTGHPACSVPISGSQDPV
jgi:beta-glucosidase